MTRARMLTAAVLAAVVLFTFFSLPSKRLETDSSWRDGSIAGVLHVHTSRSDGLSSPERVAEAAARAGLGFVVFADHGDGTRKPDAPVYRSGVLCIDAVEISTDGGHYIALGLGDAPYPFGGAPADVVEDVRRVGGIGIVAHPDSPKDALRWRAWDAPVDGVELINPDTSWRLRTFDAAWRSPWLIARSLFSYPFRTPETMARLLTSSPSLVEQWTTLLAERPVIALAGTDAHAKLELRNTEPGDNRFSLPLPGYESSFRLLSVHVTPAAALSGNATEDARTLLDAIRKGHAYTAIDAWATPPAFEFTATNSAGTGGAGDRLSPNGSLTLHVRSNAPEGFETVLWRGPSEIARRRGEREISVAAQQIDGVYRVEIRRPDSAESPPWIISNPIYVRAPRPAIAATPRTPPRSATPLIVSGNANGWGPEHDASSLAAVDPVSLEAGPGVLVRWGLSGGGRHNQYAGAVVGMPAGQSSFTTVSMILRSDQPMRVSVQLRADSPQQERWKKSLYLTTIEQSFVLSRDDFSPVGDAPPTIPGISDLLFIVDTTNTKPGASGQVWLRDVRVEKN